MPVPGWEGAYEVSDEGRVRSLDRWVEHPQGRRLLRGKMLRCYLRRGYPAVRLSGAGKAHARNVHALVLEAFKGPRPAGHHGCHGDGDPLNNTPANLRWDTPSANAKERFLHAHHVYQTPAELRTYQREYARKWRLEHRVAFLARQRAWAREWYARNGERVREQRRKHYGLRKGAAA